ncbi:MAG: error-prone DNA polymerase [Gemmatimonadetes bacterium]|nr:error-prone DNA polymerase [Gemmatimonadota bacterium]
MAPRSYAELHCHSGFSLLDGASTPEALVERAAGLGIPALALTDHDDLGGLVRFSEAARLRGVEAILGVELTVARERGGTPVSHITLLARTREGYSNLCRLVTKARMSNPRGCPRVAWDDLAQHAAGLFAFTGCPSGVIAQSVRDGDVFTARWALEMLREWFGGHVAVEVWDHALPEERALADRLLELADRAGVRAVATNDVHYATPRARIVHDVLTCLRLETTLDDAGTRLRPNGEWYLKSPETVRRRFRHRPDVVENTLWVAEACAFRMCDLKPRLPTYPVPPGLTPDEYLEALVWEGARRRYGARSDGRTRRQIRHELDVIRRLGLAGYFLIVWDIVRFANRNGILVQGRGSAANSCVCYCLGITAVDPVTFDLLFERFLSEERGGMPDIDLDIAHEEREKVLQYVYERYGRDHAAMVCETITYRGRSAVRDAARVLGFPAEVADALADEAGYGEAADAADALEACGLKACGLDPGAARVRPLVEVVRGLHQLPRHRSIHVGGFVLTAEPLCGVVAIEPAAMEGRTVIPWDKDDLEPAGLIKIDLLGLGMLTCLQKAIRYVRETRGIALDLAKLPPDDPEVYAMIQEADTVGLFQIESRAQMNTLPRLKPERFYDLVVQVAIIRPGPIQGEMVHPYIRRRRGEEPVTYLHPDLEPLLERTLGVPLFQEQGMKVAVTLAGFTPGQADVLRRAMGFKRSKEAMAAIEPALRKGMTERGVSPEVQAQVVKQLTAFANYGFPESHAASFALLVYASAYLKRYYAPEFTCALLNSQPMGFYAPGTIVQDARRHGVEVRPVDLAYSRWDCTLEPPSDQGAPGEPPRFTARGCVRPSERTRPADARSDASAPGRGSRVPLGGHPAPSSRRGDGVSVPGDAASPPAAPPALRIGLRYVRGLGLAARESLERALAAGGAFTSVEDVVRRSGLSLSALRTLAEAGAFGTLWSGRRSALWEVLARLRETALAPVPAELRPPLPEMPHWELIAADYTTTGMCANGHPMEVLRPGLRARGVLSAQELRARRSGERLQVAGVVICRQRPGTAKGVVFLTLEDETGMSNFVVHPRTFAEYHRVIVCSAALLIRGVVQREDGVVTVRAEGICSIVPGAAAEAIPSRDFR